jgi:hypothetical protein
VNRTYAVHSHEVITRSLEVNARVSLLSQSENELHIKLQGTPEKFVFVFSTLFTVLDQPSLIALKIYSSIPTQAIENARTIPSRCLSGRHALLIQLCASPPQSQRRDLLRECPVLQCRLYGVLLAHLRDLRLQPTLCMLLTRTNSQHKDSLQKLMFRSIRAAAPLPSGWSRGMDAPRRSSTTPRGSLCLWKSRSER